MKKRALLGMLQNSILKDNVSTQALYYKYFPQICSILEQFPDNTDIAGPKFVSKFKRKFAFDNYIRGNNPDIIELQLREILDELRVWANKNYLKKEPLPIPDGAEQKQMREGIIARMDKCIAIFKSSENSEDVNELMIELKAAQRILEIMVLPRNDYRVTEYYNDIMFQLDMLSTEKNIARQRSYLAHILAKIDEWKTFRR
mgnify:FL=1